MSSSNAPAPTLKQYQHDKQPDVDDRYNANGGDDHDGILLRRYQPSDHDMICNVFRRGMESNSAAAWRSVCSSRNVVAILLSCGAVVGGGAWYAFTRTAALLATTTVGAQQRQQQQQQQPHHHHHHHPSAAALGVALGTSLLTVVGIMAKIWVEMSNGFRGYVEQSLKADLASPQELLKVYGGKGAVVVAVDTSTNQVVGMVAGQEVVKKEEAVGDGIQNKSNDIDGGVVKNSVVVFELRRMSVDTRIQRRGIGQRLIRQLEQELLPRDMHKMILTCSSIQYAAHRLYEKAGFRLVEQMTFPDLSWLFRQGVGFRRYEKDY
jgi:ribosomal protein S18 acetylase RimI-like enzyme